MLLTRLGENSRIVITGDLEQCDKNPSHKLGGSRINSEVTTKELSAFDRTDEYNGLDDFLSKLKGKRSESISSFEFDREDIQREEVVREVLDIYAAYEIPDSYTRSSSDSINSSENPLKNKDV